MPVQVFDVPGGDFQGYMIWGIKKLSFCIERKREIGR